MTSTLVEPGDENHLGGFGGAMKEAISGILDPLKEKVANLQDKVTEITQKQASGDVSETVAKLKAKLEGVEAKLEEGKASNAAAKSKAESSKEDLKALKSTLQQDIQGTVSSTDLTKAEGTIKDAVDKTSKDGAKVAKALGKVVKKNQAYAKRIYKDLHHIGR